MSVNPSLRLSAVLVAACLAVALPSVAGAAASGGQPPGLVRDVAALSAVDLEVLPAIDTEPLLREDLAREAEGKPGPARFAVMRETSFAPGRDGTWETLEDGSRLWRLRISSPGASSLHLAFTTYELPSSARLWVHDPDGDTVHGPYTAADRSHAGRLFTPVVLGDEIVVELEVRSDEAHLVRLEVGEVNHGYRLFGARAKQTGSGAQGSCNIDVICPEGDPWRDQIAAVGYYQYPNPPYVFMCSGTMVNNTAEDGTPYFLTAAHCGVNTSTDDGVVVYWNYQSPTCGQHGGGSLADTTSGATLLADWCSNLLEDGCNDQGTDFALLQLDSEPSPAYGVYYAGWDATGRAPGAVAIHHPSGGEKSISFQDDPMITSPWLSTHWMVDQWEEGTTEPGSSGAGIFDAASGLLFGMLSGGTAACDEPTGYDVFGKLSRSWEGNGTADSRLKDWLDPLKLGKLEMRGAYPGVSTGTCTPSATALCLQDDRFRVEVDWADQYGGGTGDGQAIPYTDETGFFWFFDAANIELVVKILDGTGLNNRYWVFYGALSDVEYTITVTDTQSGSVRTYHNEPYNICGDADTSAFTPKLYRAELPTDGTSGIGTALRVDPPAALRRALGSTKWAPTGRDAAATTCGNAYYDDGIGDTGYYFGGGQAGNSSCMFAVKFELADFGLAPGETAITSFCAGNDLGFQGGPWPNEVYVYPDSGGVPNTSSPLAHGTIYTGDGSGEYEVTLSQPVTLNGDFWLANHGDPTWAGEDFNMEVDTGPPTGNSYLTDSCGGVASLIPDPDVNYILRATLEGGSAPSGGTTCGNAYYDDGETASSGYFGGGQAGDPNNMFAVKFELADFGFSPGAVQITELCAGNDGDLTAYGGPWPNEVYVYPDSGGAPNMSNPLAHGTIYTGDGTGQYEVVLSQPVTLNGDFWLVNQGDPMWAGEDFNMEFDGGPATGNSFISETGAAGLAQPSYDGYPSGVNYILRATLQTATVSAPTAAFTWSPTSPSAGQSVKFTDTSTGGPTSWSWSFGDGGTSTQRNPSHTFASAGSYTVRLTAGNAAGSDSQSHTVTVQPASTGACQADAETLCLLGGRFEVTVDWSDQYGGGTGTGRAVPRTDKTGMFWFFNSNNIELLVKVLNGVGVNGHYWVFYGALSDVEYWIQVRDTQTGAIQVYHNEPYNICGGADTEAF